MRIFFSSLLLLFFVHVASAQLVLKSEKGEFECRLIGRALFDGGIFFSDKTPLGNAVEIYDVRLGTTMRFLDHWFGKIEIGFANSEVSLKDIYIEYQQERHVIRVGHYYEAFGLDYRIGTSDMKFNGVSVTGKAFGDRRKLGISYIYNVDALNLWTGIFSDKDVDNKEKGDEGFTLAGRYLYRPYVDGDNAIHIGLSSRFSTHGEAEENTITYAAGAPSELLSEKFLKADVTDAINQWKLGAEIVLVYDKFYMQSEYMLGHVNRRHAVSDYNGDGWYVQMGYALLSGKYGYSKMTGMAKSPGAKSLEVLCRYNVTNLNDRGAGIMGGKQNDLSLGAIYYFNKYIAAKMSYSLVSLDKYARIDGKQTFNMIQGRVQVSF